MAYAGTSHPHQYKEMDMATGVKTKEHTTPVDAEVPTPAMITITIGQLGRKLATIQVAPGTTLKDAVIANGLQNTEIRLRGAQMPNDTVLEEGDLIISAPDAVVGGGTNR